MGNLGTCSTMHMDRVTGALPMGNLCINSKLQVDQVTGPHSTGKF